MTPRTIPSFKSAMHLAWILWALAGIAAPAQSADQRWYRTEVIVFSQSGASGEAAWTDASTLSWPADLVEPTPSPVPATPYATLSPEDSTLGGAVTALRRSRGYSPLLYRGWMESVGAGRAVHITNATAGADPGSEIGRPGAEAIDGFVRLERGDTLQIHVDVEISKEIPQNDTAETEGQTERRIARITERRAIDLDQLYYIDHPLYGLLVKVSQTPAADAPSGSASDVGQPAATHDDAEDAPLD